jgi:hypothetical protein
MVLSNSRAKAVYTYLIGKGIDAGRLESEGFGQTCPIADNTTDEGREKNRRTDFYIVNEGQTINRGCLTVEEAPTGKKAKKGKKGKADDAAAAPADGEAKPKKKGKKKKAE